MKNTGHNYIIDFFKKADDKGRLSHAYCLVGPKDVGKQNVAEKISAEILEVSIGNLSKCPDFRLLEKKENKRNISVEQIRESRKFVSQHPYIKNKKVLFLKNADKLSNSAANAFLKTLEEPAEDTVILMTALDEDKLLGTIKSRCQVLYVRPVTKSQIEKSLSEEVTTGLAQEIAKASMGLQEKAKKWSEEEKEFDNFKEEVERFQKMFNKPYYEKLNMIKDMHSKNKTRAEIEEVLSTWEIAARDVIFNKYDLNQGTCVEIKIDKADQINRIKLLKVVEEIQKSKKRLKQNLNKKLILEKILISIP